MLECVHQKSKNLQKIAKKCLIELQYPSLAHIKFSKEHVYLSHRDKVLYISNENTYYNSTLF